MNAAQTMAQELGLGFQPTHCTRCGLRLKQVEKDLYFDTCRACTNYLKEVKERRSRLKAQVRGNRGLL